MDTQKVLLERRSIRSFSDQPISKESLEKVIEAGLAAPSTINRQPWFIVGVHSESEMNKLRALLQVPASRLRPELERSFPDKPEVVEDTYRVFSCLGNAPACLLVFARQPEEPEKDVLLSIAAAIENMILAAWDMGIGSCWMTGPINYGLQEFINEGFDFGHGQLISIIPIGYPEAIPRPIPRKPDRSVII